MDPIVVNTVSKKIVSALKAKLPLDKLNPFLHEVPVSNRSAVNNPMALKNAAFFIIAVKNNVILDQIILQDLKRIKNFVRIKQKKLVVMIIF